MTVSAHDVARELRKQLPDAGALKVHKLLYYCQGWYQVFTGHRLFTEDVEAWANGPVVAEFWRDEKYDRPAPSPQQLDGEALSAVYYVVARYGSFSGKQLMDMSHREAPWLEASERASAWTWDNQTLDLKLLGDFFGEDEQMKPARDLADFVFNDPELSAQFRAAVRDTESREPVPDDLGRLAEDLGL